MPAALEDDSRDSPAHYGSVGGQAVSRMLLRGESSLIKISMATEAFSPHWWGHSPASLWQPRPSGLPWLSVPFLANHPGAVLSLGELSLFPASFLVFEQLLHLAPAQRGKITREAAAEILPILQGSMGFDGA